MDFIKTFLIYEHGNEYIVVLTSSFDARIKLKPQFKTMLDAFLQINSLQNLEPLTNIIRNTDEILFPFLYIYGCKYMLSIHSDIVVIEQYDVAC